MGLILGGVPPHGLILDGQSVSLYAGGSPPVKVWPTWATTVQITLGTGTQARDQLRAALSDRGLGYTTITEIPFEIELVGTGSVKEMFDGCSSLTHAPDMDTSSVTNVDWMFYNCAALTHVPNMDTSSVTGMRGMFYNCSSLTHAPDMDTSSVTDMAYMFYGCSSLTSAPDMGTAQVTNMYGMFDGCSALTHVPDMDTGQVTEGRYMLYNCSALTDGNVRLIGRHPDVDTTGMITGSGLTREPWYKADGTPDDGQTAEVHEVTITNATGMGTAHPLVAVTVPAGETWSVRIQGTITKANLGSGYQPFFRIGTTDSGRYGQGAAVDFSGTVTPANSTIALVSNDFTGTSFTGTVTIEK